jgi:hypothetical protein
VIRVETNGSDGQTKAKRRLEESRFLKKPASFPFRPMPTCINPYGGISRA